MLAAAHANDSSDEGYAPPGASLGCSKCRFARRGCARCRHRPPGYKPRRGRPRSDAGASVNLLALDAFGKHARGEASSDPEPELGPEAAAKRLCALPEPGPGRGRAGRGRGCGRGRGRGRSRGRPPLLGAGRLGGGYGALPEPPRWVSAYFSPGAGCRSGALSDPAAAGAGGGARPSLSGADARACASYEVRRGSS